MNCNVDDTTSDPYVVVKLGSKEKKTKTIKKELNPTWNETLSLYVSLFITYSLID